MCVLRYFFDFVYLVSRSRRCTLWWTQRIGRAA